MLGVNLIYYYTTKSQCINIVWFEQLRNVIVILNNTEYFIYKFRELIIACLYNEGTALGYLSWACDEGTFLLSFLYHSVEKWIFVLNFIQSGYSSRQIYQGIHGLTPLNGFIRTVQSEIKNTLIFQQSCRDQTA